MQTTTSPQRMAFVAMIRRFLNGSQDEHFVLTQAASAVCDHHLLLTRGRLSCGCTTVILTKNGRISCQEHEIKIADLGDMIQQIAQLGSRPSLVPA